MKDTLKSRLTAQGISETDADRMLALLPEDAPPQPVPVPEPFLPQPGGRLTLDAIRGMKAEEINRHWDMVREALRG